MPEPSTRNKDSETKKPSASSFSHPASEGSFASRDKSLHRYVVLWYHMTEAEPYKPSDAVAVSPKPPQPSSPLGARGGTSERKSFRSGYEREKYRRQKLIAEIDGLTLENAQLRQDLSDLETMFDELKRLNAELAADLKQARQRSSAPCAPSLMGARHG